MGMLMFDIILPISSLFDDNKNTDRLKKLCDGYETRHRSENSTLENQLFFHADDIQPIHEMSDNDFIFLEKISKTKKDLKYVSFHCASNCKYPLIKDGIFELGSNSIVYNREKLYSNAEKNFKIIKRILGDSITVMIENNNFYPTTAYKDICDPRFITDIVNDNEIYFLFDNAHAEVSAFNMKINYEEYKKNLPMQKIKQIQFCKPYIPEINNGNIARDIHELPDEKIIKEVLELIKNYNVKYITPEYYKNIDKLENFLLNLNKKKNNN